jgi:hypothetical protein
MHAEQDEATTRSSTLESMMSFFGCIIINVNGSEAREGNPSTFWNPMNKAMLVFKAKCSMLKKNREVHTRRAGCAAE